MAANFQEVASQFVPFYYNTFDTNREGLASLYRDTSMLTYESASVMGVAAIVDKLKVCDCDLRLLRAIGLQNTIEKGAQYGLSPVMCHIIC